MIKKYKMTRIVRNVEAIQLKENNIMEVARFIDSEHFFANNNIDKTNNITGISFNIDSENHVECWELELDFADYAVKIDGEINGYSEREFNQIFEEEL